VGDCNGHGSAAEDADRCKENDAHLDIRLLKAIAANPNGSQAQWATEIGRSKSSANDRLHKLKHSNVVKEAFGKWRLTSKDMKEAPNN